MEYDKSDRSTRNTRGCCNSRGSRSGGITPTNDRKIKLKRRHVTLFLLSLWSTVAYNPGVQGCALGIQNGAQACIPVDDPADDVLSECNLIAAQKQRCVSIFKIFHQPLSPLVFHISRMTPATPRGRQSGSRTKKADVCVHPFAISTGKHAPFHHHRRA